jgi:hypothetical protein
MEERWLRNLLVSRQLLEHASRQADGTEPGGAAAVVLADIAVETAAKAAVAVRPPSSYPGDGYILTANARRSQSRRDPTLPAVLDAALASWRESRGDEALASLEIAEAKRLHDYRNLVQHDAVVPAAAEVPRWLSRAELFVRWTVTEFFGLALEEVSRSVLIRDEQARARVLLAERHASEGEYRLAMAHLRLAFDSAIRSRETSPSSGLTFIDSDIKAAVISATGTGYRRARDVGDVSPGRLVEVLRKMVRRLQEVDDVVRALTVGADPVEAEWFLATAPEPVRGINSPYWEIFDDEPRTRDDYQRGHEFVVSTLVRWQELPPRPSPGAGWHLGPASGTTSTPLADPPETRD